mmetsp:Transcript_15221/g.42436  ORF Transcript_15221/g.42436 Transcript_15221/m.42436 type:complete len:218 (-) Transcript_15221:250-903(-)
MQLACLHGSLHGFDGEGSPWQDGGHLVPNLCVCCTKPRALRCQYVHHPPWNHEWRGRHVESVPPQKPYPGYTGQHRGWRRCRCCGLLICLWQVRQVGAWPVRQVGQVVAVEGPPALMGCDHGQQRHSAFLQVCSVILTSTPRRCRALVPSSQCLRKRSQDCRGIYPILASKARSFHRRMKCNAVRDQRDWVKLHTLATNSISWSRIPMLPQCRSAEY